MRTNTRSIVIDFVYPPIPDRNFDWQAKREGCEPGDPIAHGPTPTAALANLLAYEEEYE